MSPAQRFALETLVDRALTEGEVAQIDQHLPGRRDDLIAGILSAGRTRLEPMRVTERSVRDLPSVLPRSRFALLNTLRTAETAAPAWFAATLAAIGVPPEDHAALADDLASAWRWLTTEGGIDISSSAARSMLDIIASGVPEAAAACAAVKALPLRPAPISTGAVSDALNAAGG